MSEALPLVILGVGLVVIGVLLVFAAREARAPDTDAGDDER